MSGDGGEPRTRRYLAGGTVSLLGGGLLAVPAYDIWDDATNLSWDVTTTFAENALFLLLAGIILASGVWLVKTDWETRHVTLVAKRTLLATVLVSFLIGWAVALQLLVMDAIKPYVVALDGILVGTVTSLALSIASTRADVRAEEADEARAQNERLELLYDAAKDLGAATSHQEAYDVASAALDTAFATASYRVSVDGEVVVDEHRGTVPTEPSERVPIGGRGEIALWGVAEEDDAVLTVELFGSYLDETIQRIERESRLREERDILEFVNRTLRHDLMGDVSLIEARLRMLDRNVSFHEESHAEHLQIALDRATEIEEFVQMMRTYTNSVLNENHSLEATALAPVLEEHLESFRVSYPELSVECDALPEVAVEADELLDRVFDNLLTNAVQHNDSPSPEVTVDTEVQEDVVTVRIADNGPGIMAERRESIFEKDERGAESDGTGFGLYLVEDVVERYGGDIRLYENEPRGSVFEVDLPLATG